MEACYINTAHPDFLNGHQAIALVNERLHPKPQPTANGTNGAGGDHGSKPNSRNATQQQASLLSTSNSQSTLDANNTDNGSFFGSFFAGNKKSKKSGSALMDSSVFDTVSNLYFLSFLYR